MRKWFAHKNLKVLAPMADLTDQPFSQICRQVAGKDFVIFREMISAEAIVRGNEKTLKMCKFKNNERPIILQIFGAKPDIIAQAAQILTDKFHPDGIDINMGCPVPKIAGKGKAGAELLRDTKRAVSIIDALKQANLALPLSVKTRLGWTDKTDILEFAKQLETAGVDLLTVHGRTKQQGYTGVADWETIGQVKKNIKIPLIANGDIKSLDDIKNCLQITGADGVMIGRAALGNPWIFTNTAPNKKEFKKIIICHAKLHLKHYGENSMTTFRKHLLYYFKMDRLIFSIQNIKQLRVELVKLKTLEELKKLLTTF
jgi:nifR3 family TIM-barrel protein